LTWLAIALAFLGLAAGFIGTMLGIGGGVLISPTLIVMGVEPHLAVSSALAAVTGTGIGGLYQFLRQRLVMVKLGLVLETVTACGAVFGSAIAIELSGWQVSILIAGALAIAGTVVLLQPAPRGGGSSISWRRVLASLPLCFVAGALSAIAGIGGGVLKMPILLAIVGLDIRYALATSKMMILITASTGLANYIAHHTFDPYTAIPLAIGTFAGSTISAKLVTSLRRRTLKRLSSLLYYSLGAAVLVKTLLAPS